MAGAHKLDSLFAARPSGDGAHNSKKVFRLFLRRNIVFLCRAVKIKKEKKISPYKWSRENSFLCPNIFVDPHPTRAKLKNIIKFIILKNPQQFYGLSREDVYRLLVK